MKHDKHPSARIALWTQEGIKLAQDVHVGNMRAYSIDEPGAWTHEENRLAYKAAFQKETLRLLIIGDIK